MEKNKFQRLVLEALALNISNLDDEEVEREEKVFKEIRSELRKMKGEVKNEENR